MLSDGKCLAVGDVDDVMGRLDLRPATGRYEAGSLIETQVAAHDADDQLTTLAFDGGELVVPHVDAADRGAGACAHPCARRFARDAAAGGNQHPQCAARGASRHWTTLAGPIVDVQLAVGGAVLNARITRRSFQQLGIQRRARTSTRWSRRSRFDRRSVGYA